MCNVSQNGKEHTEWQSIQKVHITTSVEYIFISGYDKKERTTSTPRPSP